MHVTDRELAPDETGFLSDVLEYCSRTHGMQFQDAWVIHELGKRRGGYFVEFGATDGVDCNNTLMLERDFGWRGALAEPNPVFHDRLAANRPTAFISHKAVWKRSGETLQFAQTRNPNFSVIVDAASRDLDRKKRMKSRRTTVETISLNDLLIAADAPQEIDFMSIDTEGAEYAALSAFDFDRWTVDLFSVEHNYTESEMQVEALLTARGYERRFPQFSLFDGWYRRRRD